MATDTWESIAVPILESVAAAEEAGADFLEVADIADEHHLDPDRISVELRRLVAGGYVGGKMDGTAERDFVGRPHLLERGARSVGRWPAEDPFDALVQYLEREAAATEDPGRKAAIKTAARSLGEVGKGVMTGVLTSYVKAVAGMA